MTKKLDLTPEERIAHLKRLEREAGFRKRARRKEREAADPSLAEKRRKIDAERHRLSWPEKREAQLARRAESYAADPDRVKQWHKNSYQRNKASFVEKRKRRKLAQINATPKWLTAEQIKQMQAVYIQSEVVTRETGVKHNVDHLYPIKGKTVCGLHVPWNLVVILATENNRKNNRHPEDFYGDRFPEMLAKTVPTSN